MGEKQNQPFQLSFNASLKIDFQGSRVTSDGGLILVRELDERLGFIVTNLETDNRAVVRSYDKRGTAEQWIKEGKQAVKMTRLSSHRFRSNEARLWLSLIAYNLGNLWRRLVLPNRIENRPRRNQGGREPNVGHGARWGNNSTAAREWQFSFADRDFRTIVQNLELAHDRRERGRGRETGVLCRPKQISPPLHSLAPLPFLGYPCHGERCLGFFALASWLGVAWTS